MKIDCVLTACNYNPLYHNFIPFFIKSWKKLYPTIDIKIIFVHDKIIDEIKDYSEYIILFKPLQNISTAFISQYIRILYPAILKYNNGILITDMDIIPMNSTYFTKNINKIKNNKFICYRKHIPLYLEKQIPICYNVATNKIWSELFNIKSLKNIKDRIIERYNKIIYTGIPDDSGWYTDQLDLFDKVINYKNFIVLSDDKTNFKRLDRSSKFYIDDDLKNKIKNGFFSDYHCLRPYNDFKKINDKILNLL